MTNIVDEITERLLREAGIAQGMRVLDIGCGRGDLSLRLADQVGSTGSVVGIDYDEKALALAGERIREMGLTHVTFMKADLTALTVAAAQFDAIIGRRVLMYLADPGQVIATLSTWLKPGGLMVFQEHDATMAPGSVVPMPLHEQVNRWIWDTVRNEGGNSHIGFDLWSLLARSGLQVARVRAEAVVQTPDAPFPLASIVRAMLRRMIERKVATGDEIDIDTLEQRLAAERERTQTTFVREMVFCAWAHTVKSRPASATGS